MSKDQPHREQWGSKLGVILAVSGSAVGLGNFLRFPGQAATNGGGAFMIPYFISLIILGIPLCWAEWTLGRQGGRLGFNSAPGVLFALVKNPVLRLFGSLAVLIPVVIYMYYGYIEAWCLAYAWDYLWGNMELGTQVDAYANHFTEFVGADKDGLTGSNGGLTRVVYFVVVVFALNFLLIYRGLTKGIETFCRYAVPVLLVSAVAVLIRVMTLPPQPVPEPWQYSLAEALPAAKWAELRETMGVLEAAAPGEDDADPEGTALGAIKAAVGDYYDKIQEKADGYRAAVAVSPPYGFLASDEGIGWSLAELNDGATSAARRAWVQRARTELDRGAKLSLLHFEEVESSLSGDLAGDDEAARVEAERELAGIRAERRKVVEQVGIPPTSVLDGDADTLLRIAAAEAAEQDRTVSNGLGFMWNPRTTAGGDSIFTALRDPQIWMAAASQIFFSLSVGFGIIITYSTYLRRRDDVVLSSLTAVSLNETCEVCLGGMITIPAAFVFLGLASVQGANTFGLGFLTTPAVFAQMPAGRFFGFLWFGSLFLAAITSSLSMLQPAIAFLEEGFGLRRKASVALLGLLTALGALVVTYFSEGLIALDTMDFWIGQFCIFVLATVLVIVFGWVIGAEKGAKWAADGADMKLPKVFPFVIKYVSPTYLLIIFVLWIFNNAPDYVRAIGENDKALFTVIFMVLMLVFFTVLVRLANLRWTREGREVQEIDA